MSCVWVFSCWQGLTLWLWQKVVPSRPAWPIARPAMGGKDLGPVLVALAIAGHCVFYSRELSGFFAAARGCIRPLQAWFHTGAEAAGS